MKQRDVSQPPRRGDRLIRERVHDAYKTRLKLPEPTLCPDCGAVFEGGRWRWVSTPPSEANRERCQACHRIADDYPAGWLTIRGSFLDQHRDEIVNLARNTEALEKGERPLHRIMAIREVDGGLEVTTTDIHLPRRIGEALKHAYQGDLDFHYEEGQYQLRVHWTRDNEA